MKIAVATFPSSQSLQPMPDYVHPNVSGNVNSTTTRSEFAIPVEEQPMSVPLPPEKIDNSWNPWWSILFFALLIVIAYTIVRRRNSSS